MTTPSRLSIALKKPADVIPHLGKPTHWKQGRSAKALADSWHAANGLPERVLAVLSQAPEYAGVQLVDGWLERSTDLGDGRGSHSQTDLLALVDIGAELAVLAVEAKVTEPFGPLVCEWLKNDQHGKRQRLVGLCKLLELDISGVSELRYQLLHRTAAALLEAKRFKLSAAALVIHSFCPAATGLDDFRRFCEALGAAGADLNCISDTVTLSGVALRIGWVADTVPPGTAKVYRSVDWVTDFGRTRLSDNFFMRDFLFSDIAAVHGLSNIPDDPQLAIAAGSKLCQELLEPLQAQFGRIAIRSAYRSAEVNAFGNANNYACASNAVNAAHHIWDLLDSNNCIGATACIVVPSVTAGYGARANIRIFLRSGEAGFGR